MLDEGRKKAIVTLTIGKETKRCTVKAVHKDGDKTSDVNGKSMEVVAVMNYLESQRVGKDVALHSQPALTAHSMSLSRRRGLLLRLKRTSQQAPLHHSERTETQSYLRSMGSMLWVSPRTAKNSQ